MKKIFLVTFFNGRFDNDCNQLQYLFNAEDIEEKIDASNMTIVLFKNVPTTKENIEKIQEIISDNNFSYMTDLDEIEEALKPIYPEIKVYDGDDVMSPEDVLCWQNGEDISNLLDWETCKTCEYLNGSDWERYWIDTVTELKISDRHYCLDELGSEDYYTREKFEHEYIYKILSIDGKKVSDQYLLKHTSQWQGTKDYGQIICSKDELTKYIDELGDRNIQEYVDKISELK